MKKLIYMALFLSILGVAGCQKNYYSNYGGKSNKNCGCPGQK
jgi:hypothetical protein